MVLIIIRNINMVINNQIKDLVEISSIFLGFKILNMENYL